MRRHLFTLVSALSLAVSVATVALWVQSGSSCYSVSWPFREGKIELASARGRLAFGQVFRSRADFWMFGFRFARGPQPTLTAEILLGDREEAGAAGTGSSLSADGTGYSQTYRV